MARINVEDDIFKDNRFTELAIALGGRSNALGALVSAFFVAQRFWYPNKNKIPREIWNREKLADAMIAVDLAVEGPDGIYIRGSEEQFKWLFDCARAGKASAEKKGKKRQRPSTPVEQPSTDVQPRSTSLLSSLSSSLSSQDSSSKDKGISQTAPSAHALPHLAKLWNQHRGTLAEVKGCSGTRRRQAEARWRDNPSTEYWAEIISRLARSPFCTGDNERGWRASFDFLIRPETHHKVTEGKYDGHTGATKAWVDPEVARLRAQAAQEEENYGF